MLKMKKGVKAVRFDKHKVEVRVSYERKKVTPPQLMKVVDNMGFRALAGAGKGAYKPPVKFTPDMDVKYIAKKGEKVSLKEHLATGKVTVVDFYAVWCGPCKDVDYALFDLMKKHSKVAVRKVNVFDWNRPVVKQHLKGIAKLPYVIIYDKKGQRVKAIVGRKIKLMRRTIEELLKK